MNILPTMLYNIHVTFKEEAKNCGNVPIQIKDNGKNSDFSDI
jgi:hypothetical protein